MGRVISPNARALFIQDNRQGWYVQLGYYLNEVNLPGVPDDINNYVHRLEPLIRYSGVNQHFVDTDDIVATTGVGAGRHPDGIDSRFRAQRLAGARMLHIRAKSLLASTTG